MSQNISRAKLAVRVAHTEGHYQLELENLSDSTLTDIRILTIEVQNYDVPLMQIRFDTLPSLLPRSRGIIKHQVYVDSDGKWSTSDWYTNDMLMCLTEEYSRNTTYDLNISWCVGGKPEHQTTQAGTGSGL
ncbi:MAG TPA: hypothetical protein VGA87_07360 [Pyrinomonadaceae bacterium]|jgi:hypothetical protein